MKDALGLKDMPGKQQVKPGKGLLVNYYGLFTAELLYSFYKRIFMKKKTFKALSLQKYTIANLQSLTGGNFINRHIGISKVTETCPPVTEICNDTQRGEMCQRTIA